MPDLHSLMTNSRNFKWLSRIPLCNIEESSPCVRLKMSFRSALRRNEKIEILLYETNRDGSINDLKFCCDPHL